MTIIYTVRTGVKLKNTPNTRYEMSPNSAANVQQLSADILRESVPGVVTQSAFDGMVDRCRQCQNANGHSFPDE